MKFLGILAFAIALLLSVMIHEFGHYITAKRFDMKVSEFFLGFGKRLWNAIAGSRAASCKRRQPDANRSPNRQMIQHRHAGAARPGPAVKSCSRPRTGGFHVCRESFRPIRASTFQPRETGRNS